MDRTCVEKFPGVSAAYRKAEKNSVHAEFRGYADLAKGTPVTESTFFPACSITKFVTAICIFKLMERYPIDPYADVNGYLQGWKVRNPAGQEVKVTLRNLLSHTAGIADGDDAFYGHRLNSPCITLMDILDGTTSYNPKPARVEAEPGREFQYSDAGYCIIQKIIEDITGEAFAEVIDRLILNPLGMQNSFIGTAENIRKHEAGMAAGYHLSGAELDGKYPLCPDQAASSLWSTPTDLLLLAEDFYASLQDGYGKRMLTESNDSSWLGLGFFKNGDCIFSQGWGENGQCMLKINTVSGNMGAVMTNMDPEVPQSESGVEKLTNLIMEQNG